jgi:hypothetical protein
VIGTNAESHAEPMKGMLGYRAPVTKVTTNATADATMTITSALTAIATAPAGLTRFPKEQKETLLMREAWYNARWKSNCLVDGLSH